VLVWGNEENGRSVPVNKKDQILEEMVLKEEPFYIEIRIV
jgi:hypothetical protein